MVRIVSLSVLLTLIVVLGLTFFKVLAPFILPLFLAAVFAILCQPVYAYFLRRTKHVRVAAGLTTGSVLAVILVPLVVGTVLASLQLFVVATNLSERNVERTLKETTEPIFEYVAQFINARTMPQPSDDQSNPGEIDPPAGDAASDAADAGAVSTAEDAAGTGESDESDDFQKTVVSPSAGAIGNSSVDVVADDGLVVLTGEPLTAPARGPPTPLTAESLRRQLHGWVRDSLAEMGNKSLGIGVAGGTFGLLSGSVVAMGSAVLAFVIFAVSLYYFLADGTQLVRATERLIPVHVQYQRQMLDQFARVVRAVVMATFFAALAQAVATVAALWLLDFNHLFIIFLAALLMSMIPMMGTWLVWLPCAGYLMYHGQWLTATLLCLYGSLFIGMVDNVVRTYVLNTDVKLHPLLALISVLGGLQVMGLWGMFVGPIVASCLHALVQIFNNELAALSQEKFSGLEAFAAAPVSTTSPPVVPTPPLPSASPSGGSASPEPADVQGSRTPAT